MEMLVNALVYLEFSNGFLQGSFDINPLQEQHKCRKQMQIICHYSNALTAITDRHEKDQSTRWTPMRFIFLLFSL